MAHLDQHSIVHSPSSSLHPLQTRPHRRANSADPNLPERTGHDWSFFPHVLSYPIQRFFFSHGSKCVRNAAQQPCSLPMKPRGPAPRRNPSLHSADARPIGSSASSSRLTWGRTNLSSTEHKLGALQLSSQRASLRKIDISLGAS